MANPWEKVIGPGDKLPSSINQKTYVTPPKKVVLTKVDESQLRAPKGKSYLPYQKEGIRYALARTGSIIGDEMGLGKTIQAIGVMNAKRSSPRDYYRVLVICPKSLQLNWQREIDEWLIPLDNHMVVVCHYEGISKNDVIALGEQWDLLVVDEAHYIKSAKAKRTKEVVALAKHAKRILLLTGTPILNSPIDLFPLLNLVCPDIWPKFDAFAQRYCNAHYAPFITARGYQGLRWDYSGASNLPELKKRLYESCMIRRMKCDVLAELPAKRRQIILLDNPNIHESDVLTDINVDNYNEVIRKLKSDKVQFEKISKTRHEQGLAKVAHVIGHVQDTLQSVEKIILFAHHSDVIAALAQHLAFTGMVCVTGKTPMEERQMAVDVFNDDPNCKIFLASIHAAGVGLNLTAAEMVMFAEPDWSPSMMLQAEDRAHRIGQKNALLIQLLLWDRSLDARICKVLIKKQEIIERTL